MRYHSNIGTAFSRSLSAFIVMCLITTAFMGAAGALGTTSSGVSGAQSSESPLDAVPTYAVSVPLNITSDASLAENATSGAGTENDPYIITGLSIDASGGPVCIRITGTTAYFEVTGNELTGSVGDGTIADQYGAGVAIVNVANGTARISSNIMFNCTYGVTLVATSNATVIGNEITTMLLDGIKLSFGAHHNILDKNTISTVSRHGIMLYDDTVDNNYVFQNVIGNAVFRGIYLYHGDNNTIHGNTIINTAQWGISITDGDDNIVMANSLYFTGGSGISYSALHLQAYDSGLRNVFGAFLNGVWTGNYWSDLSDQTVLENGTVDFPYVVGGAAGTVDQYPSAIPVNHAPVKFDWSDEAVIVETDRYEGWEGNGSTSAPYVWEDWVINAQGGLFGMSVIGTSSWTDPVDIDIINVTILNAEMTSAPYYGAALHIREVGVGTGGSTVDGTIAIERSTFGGSILGIHVETALGLTLNSSDLSGNSATGLRMIESSLCTISNNTVSLNGKDDGDGTGMYLYGNDLGVTVRDNHIHGNFGIRNNGSMSPAYAVGLYSAYNEAITISNNSIRGNFAINYNEVAGGDCNVSLYGMYSIMDSEPYISGNDISNNYARAYVDANYARTYLYALRLYLSDNATIIENTITNNVCNSSWYGYVHGLNLYTASYCHVIDNTITGNAALNPSTSNYSQATGVYVFGGQMQEIAGNTLSHNYKVGLMGICHGIYMVSVKNATVSGNEVVGNNFTAGAFAGQASGFGLYINNNVMDCVFSSNVIAHNHGSAVYITALTYRNEFFHNAFVHNSDTTDTYQSMTPQCIDLSVYNVWYDASSQTGNLWTDWTSPDANMDDIVDDPYVITAGSVSDMYPLTGNVSRATSLTITRNVGMVELDWTASTYALFGDSVIYEVFRSVNEGGFVSIGTTSAVEYDEPYPTGAIDVDYYVVATTDHGDSAASNIVGLSEIIAPIVRITAPSEGALFGGPIVTVTWAGWDNQSGISRYDIRLDSGSWVNVGLVTEYQMSALSEGQHSFYVRATDERSNEATDSVNFSVSISLELIITSPTPSEVFHVDDVEASWQGWNNDSSISRYEIRLDSGSWINVGTDITYLMTNLSEGDHTFTVKAVDALSNEMEASVTFTVLIAPEVQISSPEVDEVFVTKNVTASWEGWDNGSGLSHYEVKVDSGAWVSVGLDTDYIMTGLSEGDHVLYVKAIDNLSNEAMVSVDFIVNGDPWVIISPPAATINTTHPEISWSGGDDQSSVVRYEVRIDSGDWVDVGLNTTYLLNVSEGAHTFYVTAFDEMGNNASDNCTFTVDITAPTVISYTPDSTDAPVRPTIAIVFSEAMDTSTVIITGVSGTMSWNGTTLTIQIVTDLQYGTNYPVTIVGKDLVGNALEEASFSFTTIGLVYATVSGQLLDDQGQPVSGVLVTCSDGSTDTTNATGYFQFVLDAGHYSFNATKQGYDALSFEIDLDAGEEVDIIKTLDTSSSEGGDSSSVMILLIVLIVVALVAVAGIVLWKRRKV